jgi:hypothetical protein
LDWRTQEVGIAAALSGDEGLMRDYQTGDVYYGLAKLCGLTDELDLKQWKARVDRIFAAMARIELPQQLADHSRLVLLH